MRERLEGLHLGVGEWSRDEGEGQRAEEVGLWRVRVCEVRGHEEPRSARSEVGGCPCGWVALLTRKGQMTKEERRGDFICLCPHVLYSQPGGPVAPGPMLTICLDPFQHPSAPAHLLPSLWLLSAPGQAQCPISQPDSMKLCLEPRPGLSQGGAPGSALQTPPTGATGFTFLKPLQVPAPCLGQQSGDLGTGTWVQGSNRPKRPCQPRPAPAPSPGAWIPLISCSIPPLTLYLDNQTKYKGPVPCDFGETTSNFSV